MTLDLFEKLTGELLGADEHVGGGGVLRDSLPHHPDVVDGPIYLVHRPA